MTSDELHDLFRKDVVDIVEPFLWSDEEIYAYMNDAYTMFVRIIGGIPEYYNDAVCLITALAGVETTAIHPKILRIREAHLQPKGETVKVVNMQDLPYLQDEDYGLLRQFTTTQTIGKVKYLVSGIQDDIVKWVSIPDVDYSVRLLVERLPLEDIVDAGQDFADVKSHHHFHFLKWMKAQAYGKQDAETFDKGKSDAHTAMFMAYCEQAKKEKETYKHKVRVVRYGGI